MIFFMSASVKLDMYRISSSLSFMFCPPRYVFINVCLITQRIIAHHESNEPDELGLFENFLNCPATRATGLRGFAAGVMCPLPVAPLP